MTHIVTRNSPQRAVWQLEQQGMHPLLARLYAARGVKDKTELDYELKSLIPPTALTHATDAAQILADAIEADRRQPLVPEGGTVLVEARHVGPLGVAGGAVPPPTTTGV